jgi:hypothetical protein
MAFAWRKTDEFCSIWSAAKPRTGGTVTAVGEYPSDRRQPWKAAEPVLSIVLKAKARRNETALPVLATALVPRAVSQPPAELLPSTQARYPRSLTHWNPIQIEVETWPRPDTSRVWNVVVQRTVRTNFPGHELRGLKPRIWRRGLDSPKLTGLQSAGRRSLSPDLQHPPGPGDLNESMRPNWREVQIQESADAPRVPAANLARTVAVRRWLPCDFARSSVTPLSLLAPDFTVSVPDPQPLR